jgi:hypothetical protein
MAMMAALRACFLTYMKMEATQGENRLNTCHPSKVHGRPVNSSTKPNDRSNEKHGTHNRKNSTTKQHATRDTRHAASFHAATDSTEAALPTADLDTYIVIRRFEILGNVGFGWQSSGCHIGRQSKRTVALVTVRWRRHGAKVIFLRLGCGSVFKA